MIVLVLVVLCLKLLHTVGKALLALIAVALLVFLLFHFFPEFVQPLVDWIDAEPSDAAGTALGVDDLPVETAESLFESLTDWVVQTFPGAKEKE